MEDLETINTTLQTFLTSCEVVLCYVIPVLLVLLTALSFTNLFTKWESAAITARDGIVKAVTAVLNAVAYLFKLLGNKKARWVMLGITIVYIVCVILYFVFK